MANNEQKNINADMALDLSNYLAKKLKNKDVKQSELLEVLSQFSGFKDWNTFKATQNIQYNENSEDWTKAHYMHIDNGGITFSYNQKKKMLMVETSFFGYSVNQHLFKFTKKELEKFFMNVQNTYNCYTNNTPPQAIEGNGWVIIDAYITFYNLNHSLQFGLHHLSDKDFKNLYLALVPQKEKENTNSVEEDNSLYAVVCTVTAGYDYEKNLLKELGFEVGQKYKVTEVNMGSSSTSIRLEDYNESFNSVFFTFTKENGLPYDIYNDPKYNSYLRNYY